MVDMYMLIIVIQKDCAVEMNAGNVNAAHAHAMLPSIAMLVSNAISLPKLLRFQ